MASRATSLAALFLLVFSTTYQFALGPSASVRGEGGSQEQGNGCKVVMHIPASQNIRIALVNSVFTTSAYTNVTYRGPVNGFYNFYMKYKYTPNGSSVRTNLGWLTVPLSAANSWLGGWGTSDSIYAFMNSDFARSCGLRSFSVLDDLKVDSGALFAPNGSRMFDVVVMGKSEYVTSNELGQYLAFVRDGGRLVLMDSDNFEVQVKLGSCSTPCETFVNGHGWTFNASMVHSRVWHAFPAVDTRLTASLLPERYYVGHNITAGRVSNATYLGLLLYKTFGPRVLANYTGHEENRVVNKSGTAFVISYGYGIASYIHRFGQGDVVCFCLEGFKILRDDLVAQHFLILSIATWRVAHHRVTLSTAAPAGSPLIPIPRGVGSARRAPSAPQDVRPAFV